MNFGSWIKKASPIILTCLGAIGTVATTVLAVRATPKAIAKKEAAKKGLPEERELTVIETMKAEVTCYIPAAAVGVGTLLCIFGANALNVQQQASLASAYALAERTFHKYKDKVKTVIGDDADQAVEKAIEQEEKDVQDDRPPWDEVQTFYLEHYGQFFERTMEQVQKAEYHLNRNFVLRGNATFNEFLSFLDLPPIEKGDKIGWFDYEGETTYGYRWVDFNHRWYSTEDGMQVCAIDMPFPPHEEDEDLPF